MPVCRRACIASLPKVDLAQLTAGDVSRILAMLSPECEKEALEKVSTMCRSKLLQLFGDVSKLLNSNALITDFHKLSFPALLLWAEADGLQVLKGSENDVAAALGSWWQAQPQGKLTAGELEQLSAAIRVKHLSRSYRLYLLSTDWFQPKHKLLNFMTVVDCSHKYSRTGIKDLAEQCEAPPMWSAAPRASLPEAEAAQRKHVELKLSREQVAQGVEKALGGQTHRITGNPSTVVDGYGFFLVADFAPEDGKVNITSWMCRSKEVEQYVGLCCTYRAAVRISAGAAPGDGLFGPPPPQQPDSWSSAPEKCFSFHRPGSGSYAVPLIPSGPLVSSMAEVEPHLVDGCLWVRLTLLSIE